VILFCIGLLVGIGLSCVVAWRGANRLVKQADTWRSEAIKLRSDRETLLQEVYTFKREKDQLVDINIDQRNEIAELYKQNVRFVNGLRELLGEQ
jgi:uncharacterized coiled-coil DUF342 family protein